MNYVGRFLSNFKGFYNDINSATLTGAIDVLVVRQEDGTLASSPWHVRFGKMGVMRAREKVVDIEINGEPVNLFMKLGEAGEAFFVQESDQSDVPIYLSTSPIDSQLDCYKDEFDINEELHSDDYFHDPDCVNELLIDQNKNCGTVITIDGENITVSEVPKLISTNNIAADDDERAQIDERGSPIENVTQDNSHYFSSHTKSDVPKFFTFQKVHSIATQTDMSGHDVEVKKSKSRNSSGETFNFSRPDFVLEPIINCTSSSGAEKLIYAKEIPNSERVAPKESNCPSGLVADESQKFNSINKGIREVEEELFDLELSDEETDNNQRISKYLSSEDWVSSQFASTSHPFSDTDITPGTSPVGSRPTSPKSDSEFDMKKFDATAQTLLTGDELLVIDDVKWEWGEFPQTTPTASQPQLPNLTDNFSKKEPTSGGLFQFMRKTKKFRHNPEQEGIYLDDLNLAEMDPDVAALYLYKPKSVSSQLSNETAVTAASVAMETGMEDDNESGQGLSLPQSPVNVESRGLRPVVSMPEMASQPATMFTDIALSLCGGLDDVEQGTISDRFDKHLVTHEKFCENPNIMTDPSLVIRMNGKFYNWAVAGPMIMSVLVFNRYMTEASIDQLIKQHMPKKERRRWWWSRSVQTTSAVTTSTLSSLQMSTVNIEQSSISTEVNLSKLNPDISDGDVRPSLRSSHSRLYNINDKFIKSLKIDSDQLASLNLREGSNEATFSVTTQYQGTSRCNCYIYLWNWDDRIIVSDIDGTITRSDVWGQVLPMIGKDWSQAGIANLYSMISSNGYKFLYLSARAIGQSKITRDYLHSVRQGDLSLPKGPLLLSPSSLISAFYKEVIERKPEEFKIGCLRHISALFPISRTPFYAGFGNKINDTFAYKAVGIPISRIFTVNPKGELRMDMTLSFQSSYTKLSDIVDHFFPPLLHCDCHHEVIESGKFPGATEYSDFTYWRKHLPDISSELTLILSQTLTKKTEPAKDANKHQRKESKKGRKK